MSCKYLSNYIRSHLGVRRLHTSLSYPIHSDNDVKVLCWNVPTRTTIILFTLLHRLFWFGLFHYLLSLLFVIDWRIYYTFLSYFIVFSAKYSSKSCLVLVDLQRTVNNIITTPQMLPSNHFACSCQFVRPSEIINISNLGKFVYQNL